MIPLCVAVARCDVDADQVLHPVSADLDWLKQQDVTIKRFNLAHDPMAFVTQLQIKTLLEQQGLSIIPRLSLMSNWCYQDVIRPETS
ncbi:arsenic metallochaperone ArsD family protein [Vibrio metschnikovii]